MKLKHLLIVSFLVLSAVPLFLSLQYLNHYTATNYRAQVADKLEALSLIAKHRIEAVVDRVKDGNALIKSRTQMRISMEKWLQHQDETALTKVNMILRDAHASMNKLHSISLYDINGMLVASSHPHPLNERLNVPIVKALPMVELRYHQSQLFMTSTDKLQVENRDIGFIQTHFYGDFIINFVRKRVGLGETGEWLFAVRNERGDAVFAVPLKYDAQAAFNRIVDKERTDVPITQALLGNEILMSNAPDYMGEPVMAYTRYLADMDWGLVVKINESEVGTMLRETKYIIYILEGVIIVLAIIVGVGVAVYVSQPIEKLIAHTDKVASGEFEQYNSSESFQEVKQLTAHFNYMIDSLKELNQNLNNKVKERTEELQTANDKLKILSITDPLTGLCNRRYLHEQLQQELARVSRYQHDLTLVLFDIDHFKSVNDKWGHDVGDVVLKRLADYLSKTFRSSDTIARFGGEEFSLILPMTNSKVALATVERARMEIAEMQFDASGTVFSVTCSFGVAQAKIEDDMDSLIKRADMALYDAKSDGRNNTKVANT
ncbi:GGDEF domain-containing protein [Pseudoalteromonas sp. OOF1S-7]|uniref:GGDEF domain-containing protein n=1 Tax=Pseudoalteromonas sp. OOF1S-7 TaxID=2917757 RepID=UPI001EF4B9E7|nr:GGDEF domain-containing protein [Pseudoalteromonas sp. OOF1S-7]MCG7537313.1 diguanylate cyclase [Pseudoalteromonas sp. OOF1S-7]